MVLFRQRRVFAWVAAVVFAGAVVYALAGTKYEASMKILVRRGRADAPVSSGVNAPLDLTHLAVTEEELNSEVELLRDDDVLRRVVEESGIGGRDWLHFLRMHEGRAERVERAARSLAKGLRVEPVKKTNLIAIGYAADDPQRAARVLQCLEKAYLEKHLNVHRPSGALRFFSQQAEESKRQLEEAKVKLLHFTTDHGVVAAGLQRDLTLQKLSEVDASHRQTNVDLAETAQRVSELERQLKTLPDRTTTQIRTADNPELLKELKSSLLNLELKRTQLLTKFEPNHPLVHEVDEEIAQAKSAIAAEGLTPVRDETTDKSTQYEWAESELQRSQVLGEKASVHSPTEPWLFHARCRRDIASSMAWKHSMCRMAVCCGKERSRAPFWNGGCNPEDTCSTWAGSRQKRDVTCWSKPLNSSKLASSW
jgi:uncharacterized protein involved in exopolysaccharide biosynthesis